MANNKLEVYSTEGSSSRIQVTTIKLTKDNYLKWYIVITMGIAKRGRIKHITGRRLPPPENDLL